jgi:hypothetical protein
MATLSNDDCESREIVQHCADSQVRRTQSEVLVSQVERPKSSLCELPNMSGKKSLLAQVPNVSSETQLPWDQWEQTQMQIN